MANPYAQGEPEDPRAKAIETAVANFFGIRVGELHRKPTIKAVALPQQIAMYLMKQMTHASIREIGQYFDNKYPSHVERSIAKLEDQRYKRYKRDLLDLVVRELHEHVELRLARERRRIRHALRRPI